MSGYDDFQVTPHNVGDVRGDHNRPPGSRVSNYQILFKGERKSQDYTLTTFESSEDQYRNPQKGYEAHGWQITDQYLAHDTDWSLFEYNPYGRAGDEDGFENPNRKRLSDDWAKVVGVGEIYMETEDVMDTDILHSILQYRNYPEEGYSSYGKKSSGAAGDKRWAWKGNTWVPAT